MTDHDPDNDDVLKQLDATLDVEPSGTFADGVRTRVTRSRTNTQRMWWGLAAAASLGLATMALWRPSVDAPAGMTVASNHAAVTAPAVTVPVPGPVPSALPERVVAKSSPAPSEPRLEVITNQGAVLRELWADYQGRPLVIAEGEPVVEGMATKPIVVDPIVVPPIVVSQIGKELGPAGATPVIRRVDATKETR